MTPRTRSTNKEANYKVYYSKKVPQQVYFPHRRKTVRRPEAKAKDGGDKMQMRFLPEKMRVRRDVADSEEEGEESGEDGEVEVEEGGRGRNSSGQKRRREAEEVDDEADEEAAGPPLKRRRKAPVPRSKRRSIQAAPDTDEEDSTPHKKPSVDRSRTLRRQSTMTQLVEGRRPLSDTEEPEFKPVKRGSRLSWSGRGKKSKDRKQQTLTQMVNGHQQLEVMYDDGMESDQRDKEAKERVSQAHEEAVLALLAQDNDAGKETVGQRVQDQAGSHIREDGAQDTEEPASVPSLVVQSVEDTDDDEESYQPTQFIDAPSTRTRRSPRRPSAIKPRQSLPAQAEPSSGRRKGKSKFGFLSTPEKRRIREIPSSQSPAESPLSTQVSPSKMYRAPLQERSENPTITAETPSKRKQVTFLIPAPEPVPPPTLRKFKSTILDSEDEDEDISEAGASDGEFGVGAETQAIIRDIDRNASGRDIGSETQAMLDQIDQACANADQESQDYSRGSSEELGVSIFDQADESSQELGDAPALRNTMALSPYRGAHCGIKRESESQNMTPLEPLVEDDAYHASHVCIKQEQTYEDPREDNDLDVGIANDDAEMPIKAQVPSSPPALQPVEDTCPSTPLVIMDSSDDEDNNLSPSPRSSHTLSQPSKNTVQQSTNLGAASVQVPRSPEPHPESQLSHSGKAEQQLQTEWLSYSQYVKARPSDSSSMYVAHDKFSYDATPRPPAPAAPQLFMSQATTVDEVTPRKNRTPRKRASSQLLSSPIKPPPLFIPSSFPSPAKARMEEWSSPVEGRTQDYVGGSLEDFSIPMPPPVEYDDDDDE